MGRGIWLLLITVIILVMGYYLRVPVPAAPGLEQGQLNLSGWNFIEQGQLRLTGTWAFYPDELLTPAQFLQRKSSPSSGPQTMPSARESKTPSINPATAKRAPPLTVTVPAAWNSLNPKKSGAGIGTYVLTIKGLAMPQPAAVEPASANQRLGLLQQPTCSASNTYFFSADNPNRAAPTRLGRVGPDALRTRAGQRVSLTLLNNLSHPTDTHYLLLQVANFQHRLGGLCQNIYLGTQQQLFDLQSRHLLSTGFIVCIVFSIAVYAFAIFLYIPRNRSTLWLGLSSLVAALYFWTRGNLWEHVFSLHGPWNFRLHYVVEYCSMILAGPFLVCFYHHVHRIKYLPARLLRANFALGLLLCSAVIATSPSWFTRYIGVLMCFTLLQLAIAVYILAQGIRDGQTFSKLLLISLLPLFLTLPLDYFESLKRISLTTYTEYAVVVFSFVHCLILGQRLNIAIQRSNHLSSSLAEEVRQQTASLKKKNYQLRIARSALEEANRDLKTLSITDGLTGAYNRLYFDRQFLVEWQRSRREQHPLSLVLVDIDHFKQLNDCYGHLAGDTGLKKIVTHMQSVFQRASDAVCRYGGEEFIVLLPNTTPEYAVAAAEKLRRLVESTPIHYSDTDINFTISIGVGGLVPQPEHQPLDLLNATDKAMYQVKSSGRNGVHLATISSANVHA